MNMGAEWEYFTNDGIDGGRIKVSIHDNYVSIMRSTHDSRWIELSFGEALRLGKFLTSKIYTGEVGNR